MGPLEEVLQLLHLLLPDSQSFIQIQLGATKGLQLYSGVVPHLRLADHRLVVLHLLL
jgi:hypothetical protein